jgi:hypothetical protein
LTIPAALAGKIPGFGVEGTTSMSKSTGTAAPKVEKEGGFKLWWLIPILGLLGLLGFLPRLFKKKTVEVAPVKVAPRPAPEVKKVVTPPPPPRPAPVAKPVAPPAPPRPAPKPVVKTPPPPPPAPKPVVRPVERVREEIREVKAEIHDAIHHDEVETVVRYETQTPAETTIQVTYENNAVDGKESRADKSDLTPDHLQGDR